MLRPPRMSYPRRDFNRREDRRDERREVYRRPRDRDEVDRLHSQDRGRTPHSLLPAYTPPTCYGCGKIGHIRPMCPDNPTNHTTSSPGDVISTFARSNPGILEDFIQQRDENKRKAARAEELQLITDAVTAANMSVFGGTTPRRKRNAEEAQLDDEESPAPTRRSRPVPDAGPSPKTMFRSIQSQIDDIKNAPPTPATPVASCITPRQNDITPELLVESMRSVVREEMSITRRQSPDVEELMRTVRRLEDDNNRLQRANYHSTNFLPIAESTSVTVRQRNLQDNLYNASLKEEEMKRKYAEEQVKTARAQALQEAAEEMKRKYAEEQLKTARAQALQEAECRKKAEDSRMQRLRNESNQKVEERIKTARAQALMDADRRKREDASQWQRLQMQMDDLQKRNSALELENRQYRASNMSALNQQPGQLPVTQDTQPLAQRNRNNRNKNKQPRRQPQVLTPAPTVQHSATSSTPTTSLSNSSAQVVTDSASTTVTSTNATSITNGNNLINNLTGIQSDSEDTEKEGEEGENLTLEQAAQAASKIARARIFYIHSLRKSPDSGTRKKWDSDKMKEECVRLHVRYTGSHLHKLATRLAEAAHK